MSSPSGESRFEIDLHEPPKEGAILDTGTIVYRVLRILPGRRDFPSLMEVERVAGPGQFGS
jgi:hypothetical protein